MRFARGLQLCVLSNHGMLSIVHTLCQITDCAKRRIPILRAMTQYSTRVFQLETNYGITIFHLSSRVLGEDGDARADCLGLGAAQPDA